MFCKKVVLRNFPKLTGKQLCQSLFFKKETLARVFSCEFLRISFLQKTTFFTEQRRWLLLKNLFTHSTSVKTKGESKEIKQKWKRPKYFVNTKMLRYFIIVFPLLWVGFSFKDTDNLQQSV